MFRRIELILTPSIALDIFFRLILFSRRGSHCSAHGGVAAEGISWDTKCWSFDDFQRPYQKRLRKRWKFIFLFIFSPRFLYWKSTRVRNCDVKRASLCSLHLLRYMIGLQKLGKCQDRDMFDVWSFANSGPSSSTLPADEAMPDEFFGFR